MKYPYLAVIAPSTILAPISVAIARYCSITRELKIIFYFLLVSVLVYVGSALIVAHHIHNTFLIHGDTIIESLFLLWFYHTIFRRRVVRTWIVVLWVLFPLFCIVNILFLQGIDRHNTYSRPLEAIMFIALSVCYWWYAGNEESNDAWTSVPVNWILSGLLLYFSSSFFLFVFSNFLAGKYSLSVNELAWNIHATLVVMMYFLFTIGFIKCKT